MRRPLSILIVALFAMGPLAVLLPGGAEAQLPACCRRHGAHHCAMSASTAAAPQGTAWFVTPSRCPLYSAGHLFPAPVFTLAHAPAAPAIVATRLNPPPSFCATLHLCSDPSSRGPPSLS